MKILIQNYTSHRTTEPMYLNACINQTHGAVESFLWNDDQYSAFDAMDKANPDCVLTDARSRSLPDVIKYISKSNKEIQLAVKTTTVSPEEVKMLENFLADKNIKNYKLIDGSFSSKGSKVFNLLAGADLFLRPQQQIDYSINAAIISEKHTGEENYSTYHRLGLVNSDLDVFDKTVSIVDLASLYKNYDSVVINGSVDFVFSQVFFDSMLVAKRVSVKCDNDEKYNSVLSELFTGDISDNLSDSLKKQIIKKHSCYNRAARLLRHLGCENASTILNRIVEAL